MQNGDRQCVLYELLSFCLLRRSVVFLMMWYKLRGRRSGSGVFFPELITAYMHYMS
jgi:hypothetical protein